MQLLWVALGVLLLLVLMIGFKLNGFISLILVALAVGFAEGMPALKVVASVKNGVGGTLSSLALILGFGAMLGKLMAESGAAYRIANTLIDKFGKKGIQWAVVITGFIVGIALFYEVGFVLLIPLVFTIAVSAEVPLLYLGIPMAAALSVTHGFLPPHPGPTAIAGVYKANIGWTLIYGIIIAIPTVIIAGPLFAKFVKGLDRDVPKHLYNPRVFKDEEMPGFGISVFTGLVPVILMAVSAFATLYLPKNSAGANFANFIGDPAIALLISVLVAIFTFGLFTGRKMPEVMKIVSESIASIAMILLIIAGGGAFKQVLVDSGVDKYIAHVMGGTNLSPLILAWLIAAILRLSLGSATVAAMTAAGIAAPMIGAGHVSAELMVLATGAGSLIFSHVNDPGFWIFKEYFNLTIPETLKTWSVLETIISVCGLVGVLILSTLI